MESLAGTEGKINGRADLVGSPVVGEICRCDRRRVRQVTRVQDQCVPGAHLSGDLIHRLFVNDTGRAGHADDAAADGLYRLFGLRERGISATDQDEAFGTSDRESYGGFTTYTASLDIWYVSRVRIQRVARVKLTAPVIMTVFPALLTCSRWGEMAG